MSNNLKLITVALLLFAIAGCAPEVEEKKDPKPAAVIPSLPPTPHFDPDSAYYFVQTQVDFGPRVPGNQAHRNCGDWMVTTLQRYGATVSEQLGTVKAFTGAELPLRNITGSWQPEKEKRILLFAHWDTRPFADQDDERKNDPIDGANDGGSGVGVLLEVARHLQNAITTHGVDIIFFDVEDYGRPSGGLTGAGNEYWCLGSQYWARNQPSPKYKAEFGILLDMCGAKGATFYQEANSMQFAPQVMRKVWKTGKSLGYANHFIDEPKMYVGMDDHIVLNRELRIPCIDIIEYNETGGSSEGGFHPSWHTHDDNMDIIDKATLKAVGQTVMEVVWQER